MDRVIEQNQSVSPGFIVFLLLGEAYASILTAQTCSCHVALIRCLPLDPDGKSYVALVIDGIKPFEVETVEIINQESFSLSKQI